MGMIADNTQTKYGKIPYIIFTPFPIAILTILLFYVPDISVKAKMVYASITYVLWGMIYTVSDVPFWSIVNLATPNPKERGKIISIGRTVNGVGAALPQAFMIVVPMIVALFLDKGGMNDAQYKWLQYKHSYFITAIIISIAGMALFARFSFTPKKGWPHKESQSTLQRSDQSHEKQQAAYIRWNYGSSQFPKV